MDIVGTVMVVGDVSRRDQVREGYAERVKGEIAGNEWHLGVSAET